MKHIFILLFGTILIFSCTSDPKTDKQDIIISPYSPPYHINIEKSLKNIESIPLSSIGRSIDYIPLETTNENQLRQLDRIAISDSFILVNDYTKLLQFDNQGKFIKQIGTKGRGPGEYSYINDFNIDKDNRKILILDFGRILEFSFEGLFLRSFLVERNSTRFVLSDTNKILLYPFNMPGNMVERPYSWYLTDLNGKEITKIPNHYKRVNMPGLLIREAPLYSFENNFYFMEYGIDTLYSMVNAEPNPYVIFNFGELKMNHDLATPAGARDAVFNQLKQKLRINSIQDSFENIFFKLSWGYSDSTLFAILNKRTSKVTFLKENGFVNDIDGGLTFWPKYMLDDSILVDYVDSFDLLETIHRLKLNKSENQKDNEFKLSYILKKLTENLKETDNPVLVVVRLKSDNR